MNETRAAKLLGVPEWRGINDYEVRKSADGNEFLVRGYASLFNSPYPVAGGPEKGGWIESIDKKAFDVTLAAKPDVHFLINHEGATLARTKSGTLKLSTDNKGLLSEARIDRRDPMGQSLEVKMERGDLDEMSFAFRTVRQTWNEDYTDRVLNEVNIDKGDVSVVNNGANDKTRIRIEDLRASVRMLQDADLAEVRSVLDNPVGDLRDLQASINEMLAELDPRLAKRAAGSPEGANILSQTLGWLFAIDTISDEAQQQLAAVLAVPNPDTDDSDTGEATAAPVDVTPEDRNILTQALGWVRSVDCIVDEGQESLAGYLGVESPDVDDTDDSTRAAQPAREVRSRPQASRMTVEEAMKLVQSDGGRRVSDRTAALMFDPATAEAEEKRKAEAAKIDAQWRSTLKD